MTTMNPQPLQARPYLGASPIPMNVIGVDELASFNGGRKQCVGGGAREDRKSSAMAVSRTSELTISFEGEVYVFPAVTPEKVQAVLLLLGGNGIPSCSPNSKLLPQQNIGEVGDPSRVSKHPRRIASLLRFREKKKERCFEKKVRYSCRKEVAQRMHRKNGQFVASIDSSKIDSGNLDSSDGTPSAESVPSHCQHCGTNEKSTPAMRRGPGGPRSLCNACGLMWASKGALRDLTKSKIGRAISSDHIEAETSADLKPSVTAPENSYRSVDKEQESPKEAKTVTVNFDTSSLRLCDQVMQLTDDLLTDQVQNSLLNLHDQDTLDELANASGPEFDIPDNFEDQMSAFSGLT